MKLDGLIYILIFLPMATAFLSYLIGRKNKTGRNYFVCGTAVLEFCLSLLLLWNLRILEGAKTVLPGICGMGLSFTVDGFRAIYGIITAFMWMMTTLLSAEYFGHYRNRNRYYLFWLITLGATEGIFLSADLYTTFVFFEIMSLASYVWVAQDERAESLRAAATYLGVAVIGGLVMLMGRFLLYHQAGTLTISELYLACQGKNVYPACLCLIVGFGAKAGAFPLHIWLPKAHPVAPAPASALLSGILTKTGIFGILVISCQILLHDARWGMFVLFLGVITMFLGALLAVFSIDFKRTLACSSVSQIGFILVGIGMQGLLGEENILAVRGTFLHMVNHSLFKLVLFLVAGVIYMNIHKLDLNEIRGFGRRKPLLAGIYLLGALGISGVPAFSGYISKTLLHESIVEGNMQLVEWIFLISGGLTAAYMCKLFVAVFLEKNQDEKLQQAYDEKKNYMNPASTFALLGSAVLIPLMGLFPYLTMDRLANLGQGFMGIAHSGHAVSYFSWTNLKGSLISLFIGALVYLVVIRQLLMKKNPDKTTVYVNRWPAFLDLENLLYRPVLLIVVPTICGAFCNILDHITDWSTKFLLAAGKTIAGILDILTDSVVVFLRQTIYRDSPPAHELDEGNAITHVLGVLFNKVEMLLNRTIWKGSPHRKDFEHGFALKYSSFKENTSFIGRSLSYGLILFCLGLCATLIYLLVSAVL